jgi:dCMP deaminase
MEQHVSTATRLPLHDYYMQVAWVVSRRSNCSRRKMGAILVVQHMLELARASDPDIPSISSTPSVPSTGIASAGYNGTPYRVQNCDEGGCPRCASPARPQEEYDWCLCVHAEQNAVALAARHGIATLGATLYSTLRPCFDCQKQCIQAGVAHVYYDRDSPYPKEEKEEAYQRLLVQSGIGFSRHHVALPFSVTDDSDVEPEMPRR